ncbi:MAG TPA: 16S rRNA (guanine(966)-N(2))-methyltransferase RsmD [Desulfobacteraceae bacterium]|nr:16S rRNA (guanine(966)-N(2))-methyltransferase RsmD [Desulfobacteraceae bacterium]
MFPGIRVLDIDMRITGGTGRGRKLAQLKGQGIRPTSDRVREAVFNMLGQDLTGWIVLDLFAGTGAFGIDAISRGASQAVFVDHSTQAIELIKRNLFLCGFEQKALVVKADLAADMDLGKHSALPRFFDAAFMDPPYRSGLIPRTCRLLTTGGVLKPKAVVIAETAKNESLPDVIEGLTAAQEKTYGDTKISIFFYEDE